MIKLRNLISLFAITFFSFTNLKAQSNGFEVLKSLELMDQIYQHLEMYYVDEPQTGKIAKAAIHGKQQVIQMLVSFMNRLILLFL